MDGLMDEWMLVVILVGWQTLGAFSNVDVLVYVRSLFAVILPCACFSCARLNESGEDGWVA